MSQLERVAAVQREVLRTIQDHPDRIYTDGDRVSALLLIAEQLAIANDIKIEEIRRARLVSVVGRPNTGQDIAV